MKNETIQQLRENGYKVRVGHYRFFGAASKKSQPVLHSRKNPLPETEGVNVNPLGGRTEVEITTPDGDNLKGVAECSVKDHYNRKLGIKIAVARALHVKNN